jgi:hypothetical protein
MAKIWKFGVEWSLSLSSNMVAHFNEIAYNVLSRVDGIHVLDVYWLTPARPDNRQVGLGNNVLGEHMVHSGQEVLHAMARAWIQVLLLSCCACAAQKAMQKVYRRTVERQDKASGFDINHWDAFKHFCLLRCLLDYQIL